MSVGFLLDAVPTELYKLFLFSRVLRLRLKCALPNGSTVLKVNYFQVTIINDKRVKAHKLIL